MTRVVNSFALLGDEEDDDMTILVEHFAKKAVLAAADSAAQDQSGNGNGFSVYIGNLPAEATTDHVGHKFSEFGPIKPGGIQVKSSKGFCFGFVEFESLSSAKKALQASPVEIGDKNVFVEEKRTDSTRVVSDRAPGRGGSTGYETERYGNYRNEQAPRHYYDGPPRHYYDGPNGNGRGGRMGGGRGRGLTNDNVVGDEKEGSAVNGNTNGEQSGNSHVRSYNRDEGRSFRGGNRNYGGERRGYGNGDNRVYRGRRDGKNESNNGEVEVLKEAVKGAVSNAVDSESSKAVSEGGAAPVIEEPREVVTKEKPQGKFDKAEDEYAKKKQEEYQKWLIKYRSWKTLGEYEKVVAEKRKASEALKTSEERKVAADKDFESMTRLGKKQKDAAALLVSCQIPETPKLKKNDSLNKDEKSGKLNKDEKPRKGPKFSRIDEFLKPAQGNSGNYNRGMRGNDVRSEDRAEPARDNVSKKGIKIPIIDDQGEFPDLKGAARAV